MTLRKNSCWPIALLAVLLTGIVLFTVRPYGWNVTALFHMDGVLSAKNPLPSGFVIMKVPSYDGAQYYQIARNIPIIATPRKWPELKAKEPGSYAYQRFLLPLLAYVLSLGQTQALPFAFLCINIAALIGTCVTMLRFRAKPLYALALCLSPAAMVALHFSLAEPLTILLITLMLTRYAKLGRIGVTELVLLSLAVLTREVNILFVVFLLGFCCLRLRFRDALLLMIPALVFVAWHALIYAIFKQVPFLMSTQAHQLPGSAALKLVLGMRGYDRYTLSAIALFLAFVLPATVWMLWEVTRMKERGVLALGALAFLAFMLMMPDYIWGSVTSIGRVITPVYPLFLLHAASRDTPSARMLAASVLLLGIATAIGLALSVHGYTLA